MLLLYPAHILQNDGWKEIDLHSTMLLLYPVEPYSDYLRILNLHSTMLLLYPERQGTDTRADPEFTFHYASTLSKERRSCHSELLSHLHSTMLLLYRGSCWVQTWSCSEFTFHYASTLSPPAVSGPSGFSIYIPLCFYFIFVTSQWFTQLNFIYIPLCFYFIFSPRLYASSHAWFTFHYASTLSCGGLSPSA